VTVGICTIEIFIPEARSLKDKRQVLRSLMERLRRRHNVSIAEVEHQDLWQRAGLALVAVAAAQKPIDAMFQGLLDEIEGSVPGHIIRHEVEFI
jgi:uncharacterized protein YlxP (DUF503 family)